MCCYAKLKLVKHKGISNLVSLITKTKLELLDGGLHTIILGPVNPDGDNFAPFSSS